MTPTSAAGPARDGDQPWPAGCDGRISVDAFGQRCHRAELEDLADADVDVELVAHRRNQFGGQQRVATQIEERIVGAYPIPPEQFGEQLGDATLRALFRLAVLHAGADVGFR